MIKADRRCGYDFRNFLSSSKINSITLNWWTRRKTLAAVKFSSVKFEANINQVGGAETAVKTLLVPVAATARHILHNIFIKSSSLTSHPTLSPASLTLPRN